MRCGVFCSNRRSHPSCTTFDNCRKMVIAAWDSRSCAGVSEGSSAAKKPSKMCRGKRQRSGAWWMSNFGPVGKFNSDFSGCKTMSTSSIMHTLLRRKISNTLPISNVSLFSCAVFRFARRSLATSNCSKKRNTNDFTSPGVVTIRSPWDCTKPMCADKLTSKSTARSHLKVATCFCKIDEKTLRSTERENSRSACGTTTQTMRSVSARTRESNGVTTVVLPWPMIICFTALLSFSMV
mmetsp:Transcript_116897/g.337834  ORF Transcript_116897/g.337834 Transcript_116897/m.337834 type:complete len:237 (+) Transcript_116897:586-1296(+)